MMNRRSGNRGFSLVEMTIVVAIVALSAMVIIPATSNIGLADLRSSASKMAGLIRSTYDEASLNGQTQRLIFDFESKKISVEQTQQVLNFDPKSNALLEVKREEEDGDGQAGKGSLAGLPFGEDLLAEVVAKRAATKPQEDSSGNSMDAFLGVGGLAAEAGLAGDGKFSEAAEVFVLDDDVELLDVWVQGMREPQFEGRAYLYFFPHGYTQDALIHLQYASDYKYTIKVSALTGKTQIFSEYIEPPK